MVVGFKTTYVISTYHHWCCEFESRSGRGVQHYVIKFVSDLRQVGCFLQVLRFPPPIKLTATIKYSWNILERGAKHHQNKKKSVDRKQTLNSYSRYTCVSSLSCPCDLFVNLSDDVHCVTLCLLLIKSISCWKYCKSTFIHNRIGGYRVSVIGSTVVDRRVEPQSDHTTPKTIQLVFVVSLLSTQH